MYTSIQKTSNQKRMAKSLPVTQTQNEFDNDDLDIIALIQYKTQHT
jgi:hypothetical protein